MNYKLIGRKLRRGRKRLGLTQEKAAELADISASFIGHIERGTRIPSVETLAKLCRLYRISVDYVLRIM